MQKLFKLSVFFQSYDHKCTATFFSVYSVDCGKSVKSAIADLYLGPDSIQWSSCVKYLGISHHTGKKLTVNTDSMKQKFFTACNSVLGNSRGTDDIVRLNLIESYCLPLLTYGVNDGCFNPLMDMGHVCPILKKPCGLITTANLAYACILNIEWMLLLSISVAFE